MAAGGINYHVASTDQVEVVLRCNITVYKKLFCPRAGYVENAVELFFVAIGKR